LIIRRNIGLLGRKIKVENDIFHIPATVELLGLARDVFN